MGKILRVQPRSFYEAEVWEYQDRIVAHCLCNNCGEKFSLTLRANPSGLSMLSDEQKKRRIFGAAHKHHDCSPEGMKDNPAETNRIVNKWHEYKLKLKKLGGDTK